MDIPWDLEQLEVILAPSESRLVVVAGPGAGKSAVACQRVATLISDGIPASRILIISFTRAAVREIQQRIRFFSAEGLAAEEVRVSTIDSYSWSLRAAFDEENEDPSFESASFELSIEGSCALLSKQDSNLKEFLGEIRHLVVDEAQDVFGARANLVIEIIKCLSAACGVTVLADPAQEIYRFTTEDGDDAKESASLLDLLKVVFKDKFEQKELKGLHRVKTPILRNVFLKSREKVIGSNSESLSIQDIQTLIAETCENDAGETSNELLADLLSKDVSKRLLVLFRRRADVLIASSYCSTIGVEHRLRLSGLEVCVKPWIGWALQEASKDIIRRSEFDELWQAQAKKTDAAFIGEVRDDCWSILRNIAGGRQENSVDLFHLRTLVARSRPPLEICATEFGRSGPILGTIHASKGREAEGVMLLFSSNNSKTQSDRAERILEECRVYYVGATRARESLSVAGLNASYVSTLESMRVFRRFQSNKAQIEVGREGDVDPYSHLEWPNAVEIQRLLASLDSTMDAKIRVEPSKNFEWRVVVGLKSGEVTKFVDLAAMSKGFQKDISKIWTNMEGGKLRLKPPPSMAHVFVVGAKTVGLSDAQRFKVSEPFSRSGFALAPIVKGLAYANFLYR